MKLHKTPEKIAMMRGFLNTVINVFTKLLTVKCPVCWANCTSIETKVQRIIAFIDKTAEIDGVTISPSIAIASGSPNKPLLENTQPVPKIAALTGGILRRRFEMNWPMKNKRKQAPKYAISSLKSAWLSLVKRFDNRRNNIAGRAILKANLARILPAVLLKPNHFAKAKPRKIRRKRGELLSNWKRNWERSSSSIFLFIQCLH